MKLDRGQLTKAAGVERLGDDEWQKLQAFADLVFDTNPKINLVSRAHDPAEEISRQLALSLVPLRLRSTWNGVLQWIDIGSGGGFPAIPLAIMMPEVKLCLIESVSKKGFFLERASQRLRLTNVQVISKRFEEALAGGDIKCLPCDLISVKAVTGDDTAHVWATRSLRMGGYLLVYKPTSKAADYEILEGFDLAARLDLKSLFDISDLSILIFKMKR